MTRSKGPDEQFCTSCGAAIKQRAELCPECGVPNTSGDGSAAHGGSRPEPTSRPTGDPSVSDSWWIGVAATTALWILLLLVSQSASAGTTNSFYGLLVILAWVGLPLSAYFDIQYVKYRSSWQPNEVLWILGLVVWIVNVPLALVYLYRRHEAL